MASFSGVSPAPTATSQQTIEKLLQLSGRPHVPLSKSFLQGRGRGGGPIPGPLSAFVTAGHGRALQQYLLVHAAASADPWSVARDSRVWARAMSLDPKRASSRAAISKNWAWIEGVGLIERGRRGRLSEITLLRDDGSGEPYDDHPAKRREPFFKLPHAFWLDEWHRQLDLAAVAVLLIGLSLNDGFRLPGDHVQAWYGMSPSTLTKGLSALRRTGLLRVERNQKVAALAPEGHTWEYLYTLQPPFGPKGRKARVRRDD